ncbi:DNA polymerase [Bacillus phage vB_BceM-HSE3]|nr:DNA polymerase [Bacillus phage vB_BceM-HSE3]
MRCELCSLHQNSKSQMLPVGTMTPDVYIIGDQSSYDEDQSGVPFSGRASQYLLKIMSSFGLGQDNTRMFKVLRCFPSNNKVGEQELITCSRYIKADIWKTKPKVLLLVGQIPIKTFLPHWTGRIGDIRGKVQQVDVNGTTFLAVPTYHPNYVINQNSSSVTKEFFSDVKLAHNISTGVWQQEKSKELDTAITADQFIEYCEKNFSDNSDSAYDIETNGRPPLSDEAFVVGFSLAPDNQKGIYCVFESLEYRMPEQDMERVKEYLRKFLKSRNKVVVHNQMYERPYTINPRWLGIEFDLEELDDTLVMARLMLGGKTGAALKERCVQDLGYEDWSYDLDVYRHLAAEIQSSLSFTPAGKPRPEFTRFEEEFGTDLTKLRDTLIQEYELQDYVPVLYSPMSRFDEAVKLLGDKINDGTTGRIRKLIYSLCRLTTLLKDYYQGENALNEIMRLFSQMIYSRVKTKDDSFLSYGLVPLRLISKYGAMDAVGTMDLRQYYNERMAKESKEMDIDLVKGYGYWMMQFEMGYIMERNGAYWNEERATRDLKFLQDKCIEAQTNMHSSHFMDELLIKKTAGLQSEYLITGDYLYHYTGLEITGSRTLRKKPHIKFSNDKEHNLHDGEFVDLYVRPELKEQFHRQFLEWFRSEHMSKFTEIANFKPYFNPSSTHVSTKQFLAKVLVDNDIRLAKFWYSIEVMMQEEGFDVDAFAGQDKIFLKAFLFIKERISGITKRRAELEDEEIEIHPEWDDLEEDEEVTVDKISAKQGFEEFKVLLSKMQFRSAELVQLYGEALNFELPGTSEPVMIEMYEYFKITGIDIEGNPEEWGERFTFMYNFRIFKKCNKLITSYITGKLGRQAVRIVDKDELKNGKDVCIRKREFYSTDGQYDTTKEDVIIQTKFMPCSAETGRWRAGIHTIPTGAIVKDFYTSRFKGGTIAAPDFSQQEVRVMAAAAQEDKLLQAFRDGADIHLYNASQIFRLPPEEVTPMQRRFSKMASFSILYGASAYSVAQQYFKGNVRDAEEFFDNFYSAFPKVKDFIEARHREMQETGRVKVFTDRYLYIQPKSDDPKDVSSALRNAQNYPISQVA